MEKRHAIIESATRLFGSIGFDATTTLEIADEADVTEPLIYYHFKGKHELFKISLELAFNEYLSRLKELPKQTPKEFQKIVNIIDLHFQIVDNLPDQMRMIVTTCPAKPNTNVAKVRGLQRPGVKGAAVVAYRKIFMGRTKELMFMRR